MQTAVHAWCAKMTAANNDVRADKLVEYLASHRFVGDDDFCACTASWCLSNGCNPACWSFNSDISGWDTSRVTSFTILLSLLIPSDTHALLLTISLCRVQATFYNARKFRQ